MATIFDEIIDFAFEQSEKQEEINKCDNCEISEIITIDNKNVCKNCMQILDKIYEDVDSTYYKQLQYVGSYKFSKSEKNEKILTKILDTCNDNPINDEKNQYDVIEDFKKTNTKSKTVKFDEGKVNDAASVFYQIKQAGKLNSSMILRNNPKRGMMAYSMYLVLNHRNETFIESDIKKWAGTTGNAFVNARSIVNNLTQNHGLNIKFKDKPIGDRDIYDDNIDKKFEKKLGPIAKSKWAKLSNGFSVCNITDSDEMDFCFEITDKLGGTVPNSQDLKTRTAAILVILTYHVKKEKIQSKIKDCYKISSDTSISKVISCVKKNKTVFEPIFEKYGYEFLK